MAIALLEAPPAHRPSAPPGTATLVVVLSPVRAPDGTLRTRRTLVEAGQTLAACLPPRQDWVHVIWNGATIPEDRWPLVTLEPDDEVWAFPALGIGPELGAMLIYAAVGLAVSIATTALSYLLFPPQKAQVDRPEEHTFSFGGIQTAVGPGNVVPVLYGTHRVGGQLLSATVTQVLNVVAGDPGAPAVQVEATSQPPTLNLLLALGEGPIASIDMSSIEINGQPLTNFLATFAPVQVFTRLGTPDQTPIFGFSDTRNTFADGRDLPDNSANIGLEIVYTTTQAIDSFIGNVVFNQGLFHMTNKGEKEDNTVNIAYRTRVHGTTAWSPYRVFQVVAARTAPVRFGMEQDTLPNAMYDIAFSYGGIRHSDDLKGKWVPTLESVTEIQAGVHAYPNTALLAISTLPSESLQGALPNITVVGNWRTVRVGSFSAPETWSQNTAWCVMDFLTHPRYGMGIPDAEIDLASVALCAVYCDEVIDGEARHTLNYVLDRDGRAQQLLMEMLGGSRLLLMKSQGLWTMRPTRNDLPVQLLSWTSVSNLKVTYTRDPDRVNVMEGRFANEEDKYQQDVITWPYPENWPPDMRKGTLEVRGVTKPSRIIRALQFELNRRTWENVKLEMDCSMDAIVLQVHDIFRFSHPLPGWGASGRIMEGSTVHDIFLDEDVTMTAGVGYQLYIKHTTDYTEARPVVTVPGTTRHLTMLVDFQFTPTPRDAVWAFGTSAPDTAVRLFRVVQMQRNSDTTVHLQAVVHNPTIYDEPVASALALPPGLFNPLGPPPPLTHLVLTELTRVQPSGTALRVVNVAWDVAPLSATYAPYAGATVYRRTVLDSSLGGQVTAGQSDFGAIQNDSNAHFMQLTQVRGHVLEVDDPTVMLGGTYVYRVVPVSQRGIPNDGGALEQLIHVAGPTTPDYYPGAVPNLRLRGQAVGDPFWEGRDVHVQWDAPSSELFNETFFVQDYLVQVWAPGQLYLMRAVFTAARDFTYTFEQNIEDQSHNGFPSARRDMEIWVWARTNTQALSSQPAHISIVNPPPDMSVIELETEPIDVSAFIKWQEYKEPRDLDHYEVHLDTVNPPVAIYESLATAFHGVGHSQRFTVAEGLTIGVTYYTSVLPYDTFGPGIPTGVASFVVTGFGVDQIDTTPPGPPTGLFLTTGSAVSPDGTVVPWVEAHWSAPPDADVAGYQVQVFIGADPVPSSFTPTARDTSLRFNVPGGVSIRVRVLARDNFANMSTFSAEATIVVGGDTVPPGPPANLTPISSIKAINILWTPPPDPDYAWSFVYASRANDLTTAVPVGTGIHAFNHDGLGPSETWYYWLVPVDTSGNRGAVFPFNQFGGVPQTTGLLDTTYISSLAAEKIITSTLQALVSIGVAGHLVLDGQYGRMYIVDFNNVVRAVFGKLGDLPDQWGLYLFNALGQLQWAFDTGVYPPGISNGAVNAVHLAVGSLRAYHLAADELFIRGPAQIQDAIITDAKITSLTSDKITAGTLSVLTWLGVGHHMWLDGANDFIAVADGAGTLRTLLGRMGPGSPDYGLEIWDAAGNLQWQLGSGATTLGITPNAVSGSLLFAGSGGGVTNATPTEYAVVTIPNLNAGDQLWLLGSATAVGAGAGGIGTVMTLWEDFMTVGTPLHQSVAQGTDPASSAARLSLFVQHLYVAPVGMSGKRFAMGFVGAGSVQDVRLAALRLQR